MIVRGLFYCAPEKECKPCISQTEDNKQQKHQNTAQQTQTKRRMGGGEKARRINSSNISSDFRMRW